MRVNVSKYQVHQLILIALHIERSIWMLLCFPKLMFFFSRKFFFLANNFKQFAQTKLYVLISTARVKCLMCRRLMGIFIGGVSNIFRGKNHTTKIVFFPQFGVISCCMEEHCYFFSYFTVAGCVLMCQSTKCINSKQLLCTLNAPYGCCFAFQS